MLKKAERYILRGISEGKPEAFEDLICKHYKSVYSLLAYLCGDMLIAEDLTQDTFASAWANISHYKGRASLKTWLHRIAYNKFLDSERGSKCRSLLLAGIKEGNPAERTNHDPFHKVTQDEYWRLLFQAMGKLEPNEYSVIVLHYMQDFSYREMAGILEEPVGTVKWRTSQALKKLRHLLTDRI